MTFLRYFCTDKTLRNCQKVLGKEAQGIPSSAQPFWRVERRGGGGVSPKNESDRAPSENFLNMKMFKSASRFKNSLRRWIFFKLVFLCYSRILLLHATGISSDWMLPCYQHSMNQICSLLLCTILKREIFHCITHSPSIWLDRERKCNNNVEIYNHAAESLRS